MWKLQVQRVDFGTQLSMEFGFLAVPEPSLGYQGLTASELIADRAAGRHDMYSI